MLSDPWAPEPRPLGTGFPDWAQIPIAIWCVPDWQVFQIDVWYEIRPLPDCMKFPIGSGFPIAL